MFANSPKSAPSDAASDRDVVISEGSPPAPPGAASGGASLAADAKHAKGPWTIDGHSRAGETRIVAPYKPTCTYQVALVSPDCPDDAARDANARLIAAAPALLAACEAALGVIETTVGLYPCVESPEAPDCGECDNCHTRHAAVSLRSAIAQATGGGA